MMATRQHLLSDAKAGGRQETTFVTTCDEQQKKNNVKENKKKKINENCNKRGMTFVTRTSS